MWPRPVSHPCGGETRRGKGHRDEPLRVCPVYVTRVGVKHSNQIRDQIFFFFFFQFYFI